MFDFNKEENHFNVKNISKKRLENDFLINSLSALIFVCLAFTGFVFYFLNVEKKSVYDFLILLCFPLAAACILVFCGIWENIIKFSFLTILILLWWKGLNSLWFSGFIVLGVIMAPIIQIVKEWERVIILRLGKFKKVKGPGIFCLIPFVDTIARKVDIRTRVTDFVAETTLTKDSVTITVDALCFWLVWDPEKAVCEVENYVEAVVLSSQTALRNAVSMNDLSILLENGEAIEELVRAEVDKKTTEWGITISHIEITEIQIPVELQVAMSKLAQAEREKKSMILISESEVEVAKRYEEAAKIYEKNPVALKIKNLNIINEGFKNGNSMIVLPSDLPGDLSDDNIFGLKALNDIKKSKNI
jgi:regulator of protease activity HflC (stomatin/prohibitin superfamily)